MDTQWSFFTGLVSQIWPIFVGLSIAAGIVVLVSLGVMLLRPKAIHLFGRV